MTDYGQVVLTLSNNLLPPEKLYPNPTPSTSEGLPWDVEYDLRLVGCELIQTACLLLKLPQTAVATGQVLFQRYFYLSSFVRRSMEIVAMACTNLAAKIEENARRIRDVINVFHHIKQVRSGSLIQPLLIDQVYIDRKNEVIKAERRLLKELGFCVYVKHPHKIIAMYLKVLEKEREKSLVQSAWNYMNDSLRTDIFQRFHPETIACACIELAARNLQISLPRNPQWYLIFGAQTEEIHYIIIAILRLYRHRPKSLEELEKIVNTLREKRENEKRKLRPELGNDSPAPMTVTASATPTLVQSEVPSTVVIKSEENNPSPALVDNKLIPKQEAGNSQESSKQNRHHRRKRSTSGSRSSSPSSSRRSTHRSQKRKKTSRRSRSRSRSSSHRRHRHTKDKRYHSSRTAHNHRKKDKRHRSDSSSGENNHSSSNHKHLGSSKDANNNNNNNHSRSHHHSSHQTNGVSSSSHRKFNLK